MLKQQFFKYRINQVIAIVLVLISIFLSNKIQAQDKESFQKYIDSYSHLAVTEMYTIGMPASVILAQAIFESGAGGSILAKKSNNHFGIKCHIEWGGDTIHKNDDTLNECFRKYSNIEDSFKDHSFFLKSRSRYAHLFKINISEYKTWCYELKKAGYATYNIYAEELIKIIETYKLYELDRPQYIAMHQIQQNAEDLKSADINPCCSLNLTTDQLEMIFTNEKDVLTQSLNLISEPSENVIDLVAEK
jgi:flagellum-specific peptidoglycan hydrolase FlgJ